MDKRIITSISDKSGNKYPAEVRRCIANTELVVIYKDYETSKMLQKSFNWNQDRWESDDGFTSELTESPSDVTLRVSKK